MSRSSVQINKHRVADLLVLILLAGLVGLYCIDAVSASASILNLILVLPVTVLVLVCCAIQFAASLPGVRSSEAVGESVTAVLPVVACFAVYILALPWLGFDVGTSLFIAVCLFLHGERRWPWLVGYSIGFAFVVAWFFARMLPYPMPMLVLDTVQ